MNEGELVERIKKIRKDYGLNQGAFAARLGISQGHLCNIENAQKKVSESILKAICYEFRTNLTWLISGEGSPYMSDSIFLSLKKLYSFNESDNDFFKSYCALNRAERDQIKSAIELCMKGISKK